MFWPVDVEAVALRIQRRATSTRACRRVRTSAPRLQHAGRVGGVVSAAAVVAAPRCAWRRVRRDCEWSRRDAGSAAGRPARPPEVVAQAEAARRRAEACDRRAASSASRGSASSRSIGQPVDEPVADGFERGPQIVDQVAQAGVRRHHASHARRPGPQRAAISAAGDRSTCRPAARHRLPSSPDSSFWRARSTAVLGRHGGARRRLHSRVQQSGVLRNLHAIGAGRWPSSTRPSRADRPRSATGALLVSRVAYVSGRSP